MATQKPGEWANTLIIRFEDQVGIKLHQSVSGKVTEKTSHLLINIYTTYFKDL